MMAGRVHFRQGFTAVELLITLFVAAAFLLAGYQLFNVVIKDGGDTRAQSQAANTAYDYMRRYSDSATNPCTPSAPLTNSPITVTNLSFVTISVSISCPEDDAPTLSKIDSIISYNDPQQTLHYATFIDKSKGATPSTDVTNGLIAWWPLNGNGNTNVGNANLTNNNGATPTTGQNGSANSAMAFLASGATSMTTPNFSANLVGSQGFSITGWVYPPNNPTVHNGYFGFRDDTQGGAYVLQLVNTNTVECRLRVNSTTYYQPATAPTIVPNTWQLMSIVYDGSYLRCYVNNTAAAPVAANWAPFSTTTLPFEIGSIYGKFYLTGNVDDVRVYNRALSASEISQLVANGAK
ncbi:MAG TPA: LamG domain-containing protein [Dongiaceae bacterium]|nr:LamG domain-containing protein [Dongiaceae bacterium]